MPQYAYPVTQPRFVVGQLAEGAPQAIDSYLNELLVQITTVTYTGTTDDADYTVTAVGPDGETATSTFNPPGATTADAVRDGLIALINAEADWQNIAVASSGGAGILTLTFLHDGRVYTVTATDPGTGTVVVANTQSAGGTDVPVGVAVQYGSTDNAAVVLDSGTLDDDLIGFTIRNVDMLVNNGDVNAVDASIPGTVLSVLRQGSVVCIAETAHVKGADVFVRITAPGASPEGLGRPRNDTDGGQAIAMTGARFGSTGAAGALCIVIVNRPS